MGGTEILYSIGALVISAGIGFFGGIAWKIYEGINDIKYNLEEIEKHLNNSR